LLVKQVELPADEGVIAQVLDRTDEDVMDVRVDRYLVQGRRCDEKPLLRLSQSNKQLQVAGSSDLCLGISSTTLGYKVISVS
jgi:hypothetical protein